MITAQTTINTVTFDGSQSEDYAYPETGCYGNELQVEITHHHKDDIEQSVTILIGEYMLVPKQLEDLLILVEKYKKSALAFKE